MQRNSDTLTAENAIFIDETPFSFCILRHRGRSRKGVPAVGIVPAIRGQNHSVIAAISPRHGLTHYQIKVSEREEEFISKRKGSKKQKQKTAPRGVTRDVFRSFVMELLRKPLFSRSSQSFDLVCDNARIHLGDIEEVIFQTGHTQLLLHPYSPELNPIEYAFSKWKMAYRVQFPATDEAVDDAIRVSAASITPTDCEHYFQHTRALYSSALAKEDL